MLDKIRRILIRKFELYNFDLDEKHITMQFELHNFVYFNSKYFCVKINNYEVPYSFKKVAKNIIEVKIKTKYLLKDNHNFYFYYKNKKLWLIMTMVLG